MELPEPMPEEKSVHDAERDRIAGNWPYLPPFSCAGCHSEKSFPTAETVRTEATYQGRLRADVAVMDATGRVSGVVEVVYSHPPSQQALEAQESLGFAYYRLLSLPWRKEPDAWLCCTECWVWYTKLSGGETSSPWEPRRCDGCTGYFHQNPLTWFEFRDWESDPHDAYCIHCAAGHGRAQWRSPGDLAGGDPREWTPDDDADPAELFLAYCDAAFWEMVWSSRASKLHTPWNTCEHCGAENETLKYADGGRGWWCVNCGAENNRVPEVPYDGSSNPAAEDATARRLEIVKAGFDRGEWNRGADLLSPIGAPGWAAYPDEPERLLAFRPENCRRTAGAWQRLLSYRLEQLPQELADIIRDV